MKIATSFKNAIIGILFLSNIGLAKSEHAQDIIYTIKYLGQEQANCFDVTAEFKGNSSGDILIRVPPYVATYAFTAKKGNISFTKPDDYSFLIKLDPDVDFEAKYRACIANPTRNNMHPIIEEGFFHFISEGLFAFPQTNLEDFKTVKYIFANFPENYSIVTSNSLNKREYEVKDSIRNLTHSIFAGGNLDVKTITIKNHPVHIIIQDKWSMFKENTLTDYLHNTIQVQRKFTGDYNFPHFAVVLFKDNMPESTGGISGSMYNNVLSMVFSEANDQYKYLVLGGLSHELFHAWMGNKIKISEPQGDMQWFFEGVNDFYGWQLALETNQVSKQDYLKYYNKLLKEYSLSPFKEYSNADIAKYFKLRNPAGRLALVRGHIVFVEVLNKLIKQGKSRAIIDAAFHEILEKYSGKNTFVTETDLDFIFRKHFGDDIWNEAANVIESGKAITFSSGLFNNEIKFISKSFKVPNFGFDFEYLVKEKRIKSLSKKSKGALAGLKENTNVIEYSLDVTNPDGLVYLLIEDHLGKKLIKFSPDKDLKIIPQYG